MESFDSDITKINRRLIFLAVTVFILWILHILERVQLICGIRIYCLIQLACGENTDRLLYKNFHFVKVAFKKSPGIKNVLLILKSYCFRISPHYLIDQNKTYANRCNEIYIGSVLNSSESPTRFLDELTLKVKTILLPSSVKILKTKGQHDVSHTTWFNHRNKLTKIPSLNIMDYRFYTSLLDEDIYGFHKKTSQKRVVEYTIAYHTVQHFQHMSSSGSSSCSCVSNSAVQSTSKPPHRSTSGKKELKGSTTKTSSKHNAKNLTSPQPSKIKSTTSKAKDAKASSSTKSSTKAKIKKKTSKADSVTRESKITSRSATLPKRSFKKEKIIGSVGPTPSMCYVTTTQSSTSFAKPLKLPKKISKTTNQSASGNAISKTNKITSTKKLRTSKKSVSSSKESHPTRILNPSLMLLLPDDMEHQPVAKSSKSEVYRPAFCKSLQTIPEDKSVNLTVRQMPGNDYLYGYQPHFWSLPNECFRYAWPMLSQPFCQQQSCPYVAPYQARPVVPVNANCQNVAALDRTPSQIFFLANHIDTTHHTSGPSNNEKGKPEKHKKKKSDKKKHSKTKKK